MTPTDLEKYRETIEAAGFNASEWLPLLSLLPGLYNETSLILHLLQLAHSRGERIKELEKEIEKLREAKYPW